ncbi:hypothetical protein [Caenispirillum bisanense]|uniref:type II toxin-antitoxin system HicB family antitoxin n=1 Tax=Caenispirillum bisanense TaxID=414052 RepID=UPI0031D682B4
MSRQVTYPAAVISSGSNPEAPVTVRLPDFPAITAVGNTQGDALSEAQVRLQTMINDMAARGEDIPQPTHHVVTGQPSSSVTVTIPESRP